jgi:S-DNA-T family DNA segregation ATPase FtsK/SpoIIIE
MAHTPIPGCPATVGDEIVVVESRSADDDVAALCRALGVHPEVPIAIDGRVASPRASLVAAGLVAGSRITVGPPEPAPEPAGAPLLDVAVVTGPGCTPFRPLHPGRHSVGRAPSAAIRIADPTVELHHGVLIVDPDATARFVQLSGRVPAQVPDVIGPGGVIELGASRLSIRSHVAPDIGPPALGAIEHDPWRRVLRRPPPAAHRIEVGPIVAPAPPAVVRSPSAAGLAGAGIAATGGAVMAIALGQAMFALFALLGALTSFVMWAIGAIGAARANRRERTRYDGECAAFVDALDAHRSSAEAAHRERHRELVEVLGRPTSCMWAQRAHGATVSVTLGRGTVRVRAPIDDRVGLTGDLAVAVERAERLGDVPVALSIEAGAVVGVGGDATMAAALVRSTLVQLTASYGPADLRVGIVTERPADWRWAHWLPHGVGGGEPVVFGATESEIARLASCVDGPVLTVVVTDAARLLTVRTGALRRLLDTTTTACIAVIADGEVAPAACTAILDVGASGCGRWRTPASLDDDAIRLCGIAAAQAEEVARRLAPLVDPELDGTAQRLPTALALAEVLGAAGVDEIVDRWRTGPATPRATLGTSADGTVEVDLVRDGPHALVAGTTGSGKSELLRTLVVSMAANAGPDDLNVVLVDFKGGSTFDACARLPHTVGVVTDLDGGLAERAIVSLDAEIRRREQRFRAAGVGDLTEWRAVEAGPMARLVVVVDEFATLAKDHPEVLGALVSIAQRGRSLGLHLVLATQRPAGVVTDDIRANTNLRIALRLHDRADAVDVVGDHQPATFPARAPGRAALRLGPDHVVVFQAASCTGPLRPDRLIVRRDCTVGPSPASRDSPDAPSELTVMVDRIIAAAAIAGHTSTHRPWIEPLPAVLTRAEVGDDATVVGLIDVPEEQARRPLRWDRSLGNLWLAGGVGSGLTSAASAVFVAALAEGSHGYVLDGRGDPCWDGFDGAGGCGAVVRLGETERVDRLLRRLAHEVDRRVAGGDREPTVVLVVDGLDALRGSLAPIERSEGATDLDRVLRDGPGVGVVTCASCDERSSAPTTLPGQLWHALGPARPGRFRIEESTARNDRGPRVDRHAQIVWDVAGRALGAPGVFGSAGPERIEVLADRIDPAGLPSTAAGGALVVGLAANDLSVAALEVPEGDHVFVGGGPRAGVSTALAQLVASWRAEHPDGIVLTDPAAIGAGCGRPVLVAVDRADRVDDPRGEFAAIVAGCRPGVTIVAGARLDATRGAYGHWVREVARSRCGLILTGQGDVDGDLLGVTLPRRSRVAPRPGLAWMIDGRGHELVQVAARMPA